jgi:hypothetical protein
MFIHCNNKIVNTDSIEWIDYINLVKRGYIRVYTKDDHVEIVEGPEAVTIVMELCPGALEGKQAKYTRHAWAVHNLIGHPLMQLCAWLHLTSLGLKIHDVTVPNPKVVDE